jgi:hypothetical protein
MRSIFLIFVSGCCLGCGLTDDPDMRELKNVLRITGEEVVAKQDESIVILKENTKALVSISATSQGIVSQNEQIIDTLKIVEAKLIVPTPKSEEVIQSALEPQEATRANLSQPIIPVASPPAVRLYVSHAPFHCPPCERLKRAVTNGEFDGFEVVDGGSFPGLRSYPAIRFETPTTTTGWGVLYGYDNSTIPTLRALTQGTSAPTTGAIFPLQTAAQVGSSRSSFRSFSRWIGFGGRSRTSARSSCSSGSCR